MPHAFRLIFLFTVKALQFALIVLGTLKLTEMLECNSRMIN
ncbi:hypothetical protein EI77_00671 [Prosthecobacter fusiformis]|uniref:Uncharacterized protein n=1 Tax=Prosthecobacter fusiformis TaxID=48464 RepID=A0A4R7SRP1_9BACT|nr:hypothetical protein EI77_00671 [Prosthecobacter fusiformis]